MMFISLNIVAVEDDSEFATESIVPAKLDIESIESFYGTINNQYCNICMKSGDRYAVEMSFDEFNSLLENLTINRKRDYE